MRVILRPCSYDVGSDVTIWSGEDIAYVSVDFEFAVLCCVVQVDAFLKNKNKEQQRRSRDVVRALQTCVLEHIMCILTGHRVLTIAKNCGVINTM